MQPCRWPRVPSPPPRDDTLSGVKYQEIYQMAENPPTAYGEQEHIWLMEFFETITQTIAKDDAE